MEEEFPDSISVSSFSFPGGGFGGSGNLGSFGMRVETFFPLILGATDVEGGAFLAALGLAEDARAPPLFLRNGKGVGWG